MFLKRTGKYFRLVLYSFFVILIFIISYISCNSERNPVSAPQSVYHTPDSLEMFLRGIHDVHPDITYLEPVGESSQGRTIWAFVLSDTPLTPEPEPKIRLTGSIHGDENITTEILVRMIDYLTAGYSIDNRIKELVNSRYIVFIPMMNPDGVLLGTRYNANSVDLNRNFDAYWEASPSGSHGDSAFSEIESRSIRDYSEEMVFHLSLTFHSGAVVVNMPFDYDSLNIGGVSPKEYDLVTHLAETYTLSGRFLETPGLLEGPYVSNGAVNGGDWYIIYGSLQDWSYLKRGCLDLTVEIISGKPSDSSEIDELFNLNREAIFSYMEAAGMGIYGRVIDSGTGNPVQTEITIIGDFDIVTRSDGFGYYHRLLLPDDYTIKFSADGYTSQQHVVSVTDAVVLDVSLDAL